MGIVGSKKSNGQRTYEESTIQHDLYEDVVLDSAQKSDQDAIKVIRKELNETPELFVLNNMLMCVMFFEDYRKEVQELSGKRYEKDGECISPDILIENVNRNVLYRPLHGPKKHNSETLVPKRLYVVNDVVQVVNSLNNISPNITKAVAKMEESFRKGYVKLKETEAPSALPADEHIPVARSEATPSTSRSSSESDSYGYSTITDIKTPKPIDIVRGLEMYQNRPKVPPSCISYRKVKKVITNDDLLEREIENITDEDLYDVVTYINSKGFMRFFQNSVFPNGTGSNLGFEESEIRQAKSIPGKVFCSFNTESNHIPCEVIPALSACWPHKLTIPFLMKAQTRTEGRKSRYTFPTQRMISEIESLNCVLVPKGYVRKKGEHADSDLEWEINFPQAERYLETFMSHSQVKCFLYLLTLHKTYIEPDTSQLGLLTEHIRTFMLSQCEANYSDWPEHRLGTKMVSLIRALNIHIGQCDLRDFFIKDKNMFQNIPKKYLRHAQKRFHEILESPVMSFIKSLRNLRYTRGKHFYHPFDFDQLYNILIKTGMESTNPQLLSDLYIPPNMKKIKHLAVEDQIRHVKEAQRREKILRKRQEAENAEKANLKKMEERRGSVDSVDLKWTCDRKFDVYKTRALLIFFIKNFIDIARKCLQISSTKQTSFYLKQATYLTKIMRYECLAFEVDERDLLKQINEIENKCNKKAVREDSNPHVVENGRVNFSPCPPVWNSEDEPCSSSDKVPRTNGVVKPRKSVRF